MKEYLTPSEAAEYSGLSLSLLSKLRQKGTGCPYTKVGQSRTKCAIRYKKSDLENWMESNKIKTFGGA